MAIKDYLISSKCATSRVTSPFLVLTLEFRMPNQQATTGFYFYTLISGNLYWVLTKIKKTQQTLETCK